MPADPIKHIVVLMFENHSFDQMLGCFSEKYSQLEGVLPPASARINKDRAGAIFPQVITEERELPLDPKHEHKNVMEQIANNNSGFVLNFEKNYPQANGRQKMQIMTYYPRGFLPGLHSLAEDFTICDRWFSSLPGPTWPNRFFALTGTCRGIMDMPEGTSNLSLFDSFDQDTIFDRLNEGGVPWRVYYDDIPQSLILKHQRCPQNKVKYVTMTDFKKDVSGPESSFPAFSFIEPSYYGLNESDDHPPHDVMKAQRLLVKVYNDIRANADLWNSTLLVVFYDEHGGFYDHVPPPATVAPDNNTKDFAFDVLGVRVPALLVSPWVDRRLLSTQFDHTSLLRYVCDKWNLRPLGNRARVANSIAEAISKSSAPRTDTIERIQLSSQEMLDQNAKLHEMGLAHGHNEALRSFAHYLEGKMANKDGAWGMGKLESFEAGVNVIKRLFTT